MLVGKQDQAELHEAAALVPAGGTWSLVAHSPRGRSCQVACYKPAEGEAVG